VRVTAQARFGGGLSEKGQKCHLAGSLPYMVRPLPFLDDVQYHLEHSAALSESMAAQAPAQVQATLLDTEHDGEGQWRVEPIKKRKRRAPAVDDTSQGELF